MTSTRSAVTTISRESEIAHVAVIRFALTAVRLFQQVERWREREDEIGAYGELAVLDVTFTCAFDGLVKTGRDSAEMRDTIAATFEGTPLADRFAKEVSADV